MGARKRPALRRYAHLLQVRPDRDVSGTQKIRETVQLAQDGDSYTAVAISDQFDPNGNLVASGLRATITATRIKVERIPDVP